jgi:hypothetical protein
MSHFARLLGRSTVGPHKNPKVGLKGQKSGDARLLLFRPKWTDGARADFWVYRREFFQALAKKWVEIWKFFEESQKCRAKKIIFLVEPVPLDTSLVHQSSCNTFFFEEYFFLGESWEKCVLAPPTPQTGPPLPRVNAHHLSGFARYLGRSTVGPQKNPRVPHSGQFRGDARLLLFRPKWTDGARDNFSAYSGGFFLSLAKKWVEI